MKFPAENSSEFHRASWHKSCYAKFNSCKLERAKLKRNHSSSTAAQQHSSLAVIRQKQAFAVSDNG